MVMSRSRTVWLFFVGATATLATACGGDHHSSDPVFQLEFNLVYLPPADQPNRKDAVTCGSADTPTVQLTSTNVGTNFSKVDKFTCDPKSTGDAVQSSVLPLGRYEVGIALFDSSGDSVSENSGQFDLAVRGPNDLGAIEFPIQSFHATWSILKGGQPVQCAAVGATRVTLTAMLGDKMAMSKDFPCSDRALDSPAILTGPYTVQMSLGNATQTLAGPLTMPLDVNDTTRAVLPPVTFDVP